MPTSNARKAGSHKAAHKKKDRAAEIANTFEWLITAFILAFMFRAFVMEAFRIPTGSMADTLMGAHFRQRCSQCGYKYNYGLGNYGQFNGAIPRGYLKPKSSRCPSCGYYQRTGGMMVIANGDRILVLKCIYQFLEPKRWDVVVFRNPLKPTINYIKRLVGRPGETVEIIDGDIYINGEINRKPTKVQNELWMPVYNNDYQPVRPQEVFFNGHAWQQPFRNEIESEWKLDEHNPTVFWLDSTAGQINTLIYDSSIGNDFRATYAYNDVKRYNYRPYCSDLMVRFYCFSMKPQGCIGASLSKYETEYRACVDFAGNMVIKAAKSDKETELARRTTKVRASAKPTLFKFANVDHQLIFQFGDEKLNYDLGQLPGDVGERKTDIEPQVKIFGCGKVRVSHIAIFRDIHYTAAKSANSTEGGKAMEGNPFALGENEFFMLGDNSPSSQDSRWWSEAGVGNNGLLYREGIVPRDYLVGKAFFVYWPGGFEFPWPQSLKTYLLKNSQHNGLYRVVYYIVSWKWVPNIGRLRFIYNGSNKNS